MPPEWDEKVSFLHVFLAKVRRMKYECVHVHDIHVYVCHVYEGP